MSGRFKLGGLAAAALAAGALSAPVTALAGHAHPRSEPARRAEVRQGLQHVLVISVDGMHQSDLEWYARNHPNSELAALAGHGAQYANAQTQVPSDSFPGTVGMFTARDAGLRTAYSDKHPAYEILDGPSGNGIDDLFTPEIDSLALEPNGTRYPGNDTTWTSDNAATMQYDPTKVQAVINEIDGYNHSR